MLQMNWNKGRRAQTKREWVQTFHGRFTVIQKAPGSEKAVAEHDGKRWLMDFPSMESAKLFCEQQAQKMAENCAMQNARG